MAAAKPAVVMIVFNRPEPTARVFAAVAQARPEQLFIIGDGARAGRAGETERVAAVRAIVARVDWPCEVRHDFSEINLGARQRVTSGLDWVFGRVGAAIILEDDCVPAPAFFTYCAELLDKYRDDRRIYSISGSNFARTEEPPAHYFSRFSLMWGWATWADRWADYAGEPTDADAVISRTWAGRPLARTYWRQIFRRLKEPGVSIWDYQWILTLWRHRALCCRPTMNLVENIGFGADATHTRSADAKVARLPVYAGTASFATSLGPVAPDIGRDAIDEREWAMINPRSLLAMAAPGLYCLWQRLR